MQVSTESGGFIDLYSQACSHFREIEILPQINQYWESLLVNTDYDHCYANKQFQQ